MDHLYEVAGTRGAAVQEALFGWCIRAAAAGRARRRADTGRQRRENRRQMAHDVLFAADHQAVTARFTSHTAAGADIEVVHAGVAQTFCPAHVVSIERITAVDDDVAVLQVGHERLDRLIDNAGRYHEPNRAWARELGDEFFNRSGTNSTVGLQCSNGFWTHIVDDARVAMLHQASHHAGSHAAESDHSELHRLLHVCRYHQSRCATLISTS